MGYNPYGASPPPPKEPFKDGGSTVKFEAFSESKEHCELMQFSTEGVGFLKGNALRWLSGTFSTDVG